MAVDTSEATAVLERDIPEAAPAPLAPPQLGPQLLSQLLQKLGGVQLHSAEDLLSALKIVALAVAAGLTLKITGATLGAIDDIPLLGGLLELVGLVSLLNFLAKNALQQSKRAELLARIRTLKADLLG